jgi:hypothetical protein
MTLPSSQQHALDAIDGVLQLAEPRLATAFGVFNDLARLEAMPAAETLPPGPWWTRHRVPGLRHRPGRAGRRRNQPGQVRRIVLVPVLLLAAVSLLIVTLVSTGAAARRGCGQAVAAIMTARLRGTVSDTAGSGGTGCPSGPARPAAGKG